MENSKLYMRFFLLLYGLETICKLYIWVFPCKIDANGHIKSSFAIYARACNMI